ncbi:hypothetical protein BpHYR1_053294 [Brachionus plicatilis]|uniref:Uncharacterized protein n=1 Tax=Brachionus plicatilis TaxID=10195 RepID=A0A3M7RJ26_BRAPC|nr:hypothetical protein BpHYR1_053294 [Brachionus plicatilis]
MNLKKKIPAKFDLKSLCFIIRFLLGSALGLIRTKIPIGSLFNMEKSAQMFNVHSFSRTIFYIIFNQ